MPMLLDIHGLTNERTADNIFNFLKNYVDPKHEDRGDEDLMMMPLGLTNGPKGMDQWDCQPARTISDTVQRGLDYPRRSFSNYYPCRLDEIEGVSIDFTLDNKLVLGFSIEYGNMEKEEHRQANQLLDVLFDEYCCYMGFVIVEEGAPMSEKLFRQVGSSSVAIYSRGMND